MKVEQIRYSLGANTFSGALVYEEAVTRLADWIRQDRIRYVEDIVDGIENCPGAIAELYRGENLGKRLIRLRR